jgi:nucleoside 2-deoxyribosyltransferase
VRIYLAARYTRRLELCEYKAQLERLGCTITSRWLNGSHQISNQDVPLGDSGELLVEKGDRAAREMCEHFAKEDREDVYSADIIIAFTEEPRSGHSRGGRHVELGLAIARGKRIYSAGYRS